MLRTGDNFRVVLLRLCAVFSIVKYCHGGPTLRQVAPVCGQNWTLYKDEKCIDIYEEVGLLGHGDAEEACQNYMNESSKGVNPKLLTVKSDDEQVFMNKFLFTGKNALVDHVWLGLTKNEDTGTYEWNDGGEVMLTNWAQRTLSEGNVSCVQLESGEAEFGVGQWVKVNCKKRNVVVCEKVVTWPLDRVQHTVISVKRQLASSAVRHVEVQKNVGELKKQYSSTEAKLKSVSAKQEASDAETKYLTESIEVLEKKVAAVLERNKVLDEQIEFLRKVASITEESFTLMKKQVQETEAKVSILIDKVSALEKVAVSINDNFDMIEERFDDMEEETQAESALLSDIKKEKEQQFTKLNHAQELHDKKMSNLELKIAIAEEKINDLKRRNNFAGEKLDYFRKQEVSRPSSKGTNASESSHRLQNMEFEAEQRGHLVATEQKIAILFKITEDKLGTMRKEATDQIQVLEDRAEKLDHALSVLEAKYDESVDQNVKFIHKTAAQNEASKNNNGTNKFSNQSSEISFQQLANSTMSHSATAQQAVTADVPMDYSSREDEVDEDYINAYSDNEEDTGGDSRDLKPSATDGHSEAEICRKCAQFYAGEMNLTAFKERHQKLEEVINELKEKLKTGLQNSNDNKNEVTKEMLNAQKKDVEEKINIFKDQLQLKLTVLEQRSDVADQMFTALKQDTIIKISALEHRLSGSMDKEKNQNAAETKGSSQENEQNFETQSVTQDRREFLVPDGETNPCCGIPIGFTYVQLPGQQTPGELWPSVAWRDISVTYAGLFFRAIGGEADVFGQVQEGSQPHLEFRNNLKNETTNNNNFEFGNWSTEVYTGNAVLGSAKALSLRFRLTKQEIRPRNTAVRIWTRIKKNTTGISSSPGLTSSSSSSSLVVSTSVFSSTHKS